MQGDNRGARRRSVVTAFVVAWTCACGAPNASVDTGTPPGGAAGGGNTVAGQGASNSAGGNVVLAAGNVQLVGSNFNEHDGVTVHAVVVTRIGRVVASAQATVVDGAFALQLPVSVADGYGNQVAYYLDLNGDGTCNVAPADLLGTATVPADGVGRVQPGDVTPLGCAPFGDFDLLAVGRGFAAGANVVVAVAEAAHGTYVAGPLPVTVSAGTGQWSVQVLNLLVAGRAYTVQAYRDADGSGACRDPGWAKQTAPVQANTQVQLDASAAGAQVCASFP